MAEASTVSQADRSTTERLIDATLESIHRFGLGDTTVTTVTELAGLSRGMVRHEFGTKQQMVVAAMTDVCDRWLAATEPDPTLAGAEQVRSIVRAMFAPEVFTPVAVDAWLALSVEARSDDELRVLRDRAQQRWIDQLTVAFRAAAVPDPGGAAVGLMAAADGLWLSQRFGDHSSDGAAAVAAALRVADALLEERDH